MLAAFTTWGTSCAAEQPFPTTATRFPAMLSPWFQRAECQILPVKSSCPGIVQSLGIEIEPTQETRISASLVKIWSLSVCRSCTRHTLRSEFQRASINSVPNLMCGRIPNLSTVEFRYSRISGWSANRCDQSGFGLNENEYLFLLLALSSRSQALCLTSASQRRIQRPGMC